MAINRTSCKCFSDGTLPLNLRSIPSALAYESNCSYTLICSCSFVSNVAILCHFDNIISFSLFVELFYKIFFDKSNKCPSSS